MSLDSLTRDLRAGLPDRLVNGLDIWQVSNLLGVGPSTTRRVIQNHRRYYTKATEALLCFRGHRSLYWLSLDPNEIAHYGQSRCRGIYSDTDTLAPMIKLAVVLTKTGTTAGKDARQRQSTLDRVQKDLIVLSS